jgi:hypothetical protein
MKLCNASPQVWQTSRRLVLLDYLQSEFRTFLREEADKLAPHCGPSVDHTIELIETEGKQPEIP